MERSRAGEAEGDSPGVAARRPAGRADRVLDLLQDCLRLGKQGVPRLGQFDPARLAAEQLDLQLGFERLDLLAQRRLLNAQPLGGAGDVAFLGDRDEVAEMAQFHMSINMNTNRSYGILDTPSAEGYLPLPFPPCHSGAQPAGLNPEPKNTDLSKFAERPCSWFPGSGAAGPGMTAGGGGWGERHGERSQNS